MSGPGYASDSAAPERTALAWQRTALSLAVAAIVIGRLSVGTLGPLAVVGAALAALFSAGVLLARRVVDRPVERRGGAVPLLLTLAVVTLGVVEVVAAVVG
ncbi:MAG TPA: DUF202 domain-containing protein [Nocardioides sp.]